MKKTAEYTMRGLELGFWRQVKMQAVSEGLTLKGYIVKVLKAALYGAAK